MKAICRKWISGLAASWEMLIDLPLPEMIQRFVKDQTPAAPGIAVGFPLLGLLAGVVLAIFCGILNASWINPLVAAGVFAVAAAFFCEFKDSGRGLRLLVSAVSLRLQGYPWSDSVLTASDSDGSLDKGSGSIIAAAAVLVEILCFVMLAKHRASLWCIAVFAGAFTIQMLLAALERRPGEIPFLPLTPEEQKKMWIAPACIGIVLILIFPAAGIAAAAIVGGLGSLIRKNFILNNIPVTAEIITLCGKIAELLLLFCGLLFVV